ncbi:hypothetical protein B566_EDAN013461 [Ephemera danica]|nr:hypothetical protein B566_EDAN013461 [Ephemera danica]
MSTTKLILADDWGCDLTPETRRVARQQLREDDAGREQALQQMRDWIRKTQDIQNYANFLLRFLRVKKFSVPMAQQTLLKYLTFRQSMPHLCAGLDFLEPSVHELLSSGYIFALPERDSEGRRVIFTVASKLNPYKYTCTDMAKAHMIAYEALLEDEDNQVHGFCHVGDLQHVSVAHATLWSPNEFAATIKLGEQSVPMRHRQIHLLNLPSAAKIFYDFARQMFSDKLRKRFQIHSGLNELHEKLNPKILPKEYGGIIPMKDMIDAWMRELLERRERLVSLDQMSLSRNFKLQSNRKSNGERLKNSINSLPGSFRRLEVD